MDRGRGNPRPPWQHARRGGLKRLRERIRVLSGDTIGGASLEDLARGVARRFPDLPPLPRTTAPVDPLRLTFDEMWVRLERGHCAVLNGNPIKVADPKSPLRLMQAKDDFDHAVFVHAARGERSFVMDPLGRGRYQGQWVPKTDLRQFASRFATSSGSPYCALVKRGQESRVERVRRATRERALVQARDAIEALRRAS